MINRSRKSHIAPVEWVGGVFEAPFYSTGPAPERPIAVAWLSRADGAVKALTLHEEWPRAEDVFAALEQGLARPHHGDARQPARLVVEDPVLAAQLREFCGSRFEVVVGPAPELTDLDNELLAHDQVKSADRSYTEEGRIASEVVGDFFDAARTLFRVKPWRLVPTEKPFRVDVSQLDGKGLAVVVIGQGRSPARGLMIFQSLEDLAALQPGMNGGRYCPGVDLMRLMFVKGSELSDTMRRETLKEGWPVAGANAYPLLDRVDESGVFRPLVHADFYRAMLVAEGIASFLRDHPYAVTRSWSGGPVRAEYWSSDQSPVTVWYPWTEERRSLMGLRQLQQ